MFIKRIFLGAAPQICFGFLLTFSSSIGQTFFISLFAGEIRSELNISHGMFGTFYSAATLTSALFFLWFGKFTDQFDSEGKPYLTKQDVEDVKKVWALRLPALGIKQRL